MAPLRIAINGAAGRMGKRLVALAADDSELVVAAAVERAQHGDLGTDAGLLAGVGELGVPLTAEFDGDADVAIDFSTPAAAMTILETCTKRNVPLVLATTGFDEAERKKIVKAAAKIALLQSPNMSLAVNLLMKLAAIAARALKDHPSGADVEILERHHRFKEDAPSGTALKFGQIIASLMGQTEHRHGRSGRPGQRPRREIGYHALRVGDNPGEHTIVFAMLGETIELTVRATSRDCYAQGALIAAKYLAGKGPGLYSIESVLGL